MRVVVVVAFLSGCPPTDDYSCDISTDEKIRELVAEGVVGCSLEVHNTSLADLDAFVGLERVQGVSIFRNDRLSDIDGISAVDHSESGARVEFNPLLTAVRLDAAPPLSVRVSCNGAVQTIAAAAATKADGIAIEYEEALAILSLPLLESTVSLDLYHTGLATLSGVPQLRDVEQTLRIRANPSLPRAEIDALLARLDPPPAEIDVCGNLDDEPCPSIDGEPCANEP